ncbi:response regulator [Oricola thermophila]|uniref:histidine kinase n=1 Tax=Oricola thermophila TaxID=2742145 RepID=A0A6N1V951_9HYPH|nr:response regulator [Oricola thermophila]QKV17248.1 response regulator [Oricola thermophila]
MIGSGKTRPETLLPETANLEDYQALLSVAADWIWFTDKDHKFCYFAGRVKEATGVDPEKMLGKSRKGIFLDNANGEIEYRAHLETLDRHEPFRDFIYKFIDPQGEVRWIAVDGHPVFDANGEFQGYRGLGRSLGGVLNKLAEVDQARREKRQLETIIDAGLNAVSSGIVIYGPDERIAYANDAVHSMFPGVSDMMVPGTALADLLREAIRRGVYAEFDEIRDLEGEALEREVGKRLAEHRTESHVAEQQLPDGRWCRVENRRLENGIIVSIRTEITDWKRHTADMDAARAEVEKSFALLQTILDNVPIGMIVYDEDDRFLLANRTLRADQPQIAPAMQPGKKLEEAVEIARETGVWNRTDDTEVDRLFETDPEEWKRRKLEEFRQQRFESMRHTADGRWFKIVNIRTDEGLMIGLRMDVTELKNQQTALAERLRENELYQNIIEAIPASVYAKTPDLKLVYANSGWEKFSGMPIAEALGKTDEDVYGETGREFMEADRRVLETGEVQQVEEIGRNADGTPQYRLARKSMATGSDGSVYLVGVTTDISELKAREQDAVDARTKAELAQNVLDRLSSPVMVKNAEGIYVIANKAFADIHGKSIEEIVGSSARELIPPEDYEKATMYEDEVMATGETRVHEHDIVCADGTVFAAKVFKSRERLADGNDYLVVRIEDISKFRKRENALREAQHKAEAADRAKSEFLANMSHEIRTPMNGVLGMAELLAASELNEKQRTFADVIIKSGNALLTIINDILDFSKIDAGQLELDPAPFDLREAVTDVATLMTGRARQKDIEMIVRVDPAVHDSFVGDVGRLRQVLTNLVSNAVKFTEYGHVLIDVDGRDLGDRTELTFKVTDTGIGIPPEKLETIFEKFSQVDGSSTRRHEGTGLGLAISSSIVKMMGGDYGVESTPNEGSTFWFTVTLPKHGERVVPARPSVDVTGSRILVVDDNEVNRSILSEQMSAWKFETVAVGSGVEALQALREAQAAGKPFDCMVLDYQMPGMNGLDVAASVRLDSRLSATPIVILTSADNGVSLEDIRRLAIEKNLMKPARASMLLEAIVGAMTDPRDRQLSPLAGPVSAAGAPAPESPETAEAAGAPRADGTTRPVEGMVAAAPRRDEPARPAGPEATVVATPTVARAEPGPAPAGESSGSARDGASADAGEFALDILIAEDNDVNQLVFSQILFDSGYRFEIVGDGRQAVDTSERKPPRLILMDVSMPELNGLEATALIREREQAGGRRTPIIGVTAHALKGDREKCLEAGMDDYLSKPISPDALLAKVAEWLERSDPAAASG